MITYVLIGLCFSLAGVAGLQLMYMFYLDRIDRERKKRIHELEKRCKHLSSRLIEAEDHTDELNKMIEALNLEIGRDEEVWADVIDDR